ncbi:MAG: hypothetical protein HY053_02310 [Proteobacteria bacterium]|nr:hypothetical protein [Pseudomonadota bacterium]
MARDEKQEGRWMLPTLAMDEITRADIERANERYPESYPSSVEADLDGNPHRVTIYKGQRYTSPIQPYGKAW